MPKTELYTTYKVFGGYDFSERQMVAFLPDALYYEWQFPIAYLEIVPSYPKFAEKLGHRDILGSMMNLGVDRSKLGDIVICEDKYFLICEESMAPYFMENLDKIRHTVVKLSPVSADALGQQQKFEEKDGIITSNRLDSMIACVYKFSRSQALEFFKAEKVFVNGKKIAVKQKPGSYIAITRLWKDGDRITADYPMCLRVETTPDNPQKGALIYGPLVLAGERGTDGMQAPAPDSNPALYNDYYTYDYHIPAGLRTTLKLDVEHPERSVQRVGTELKFTTSQGDVIEPLYNIHRQRYVVYWDLEKE